MPETIPTIPRRADVCALLAAALFPSVAAWLYFIALTGCPTAVQQTVYAAGKIVQFGFPLVWVYLVRRSRFGITRPRMAGIAAGLAFGAAVFALMTVAYFGWLRPSGILADAVAPLTRKLAGFAVTGPAGFIALGVFYCLIHSLLEEYYWRWFLFGGLRRLLPTGGAILLSSLGFAAHHVIVLAVYFGWNSWQTPLFALGVAVGGAVWAWIYARSNSLLGSWLSHVLIDAAIFVIGYDLVRG